MLVTSDTANSLPPMANVNQKNTLVSNCEKCRNVKIQAEATEYVGLTGTMFFLWFDSSNAFFLN